MAVSNFIPVIHSFMKVSAFFAALALVAFSTACDKHSWEETQVLHEGMHKEHHEEGDHDDKADSHAEVEKGHDKGEAHPAKKKADH